MPNINHIHLPDGNTYDLVKKELTRAEYDALTEEEKNNGTVYLISDVSSSRIAIETLINIIYPVGSIYISVTDDTVAKVEARFGGTWEAFAQGRTLVGVSAETEFNTVQKTGGEKVHTLTTAEMPSHYHDELHWGSSTSRQFGVNHGSSDVKNPQWYFTYATVSSTAQASFYSGNTGGSGSHNNLQPYITTYMYKRIA